MENIKPNVIIELMTKAQQTNGLDGFSRKTAVLHGLRVVFGDENYIRYEPILSLLIDLLKQLSRNTDILKGLRKNKYFKYGCI